jgi:hypothetical protein
MRKDERPVNGSDPLEGDGHRPLRIGIVTDGLKEAGEGDAARIGNGGVGVYIAELVAALLRVDTVDEYTLLRCGEAGCRCTVTRGCAPRSCP